MSNSMKVKKRGDQTMWHTMIKLFLQVSFCSDKDLDSFFLDALSTWYLTGSVSMVHRNQRLVAFLSFSNQNIAKLRPGQTLALAEPEARHYNHPATPPPRPPAANVCIAYISAISQRIQLKFCMTVIQVERIKSADKTQTLQHCSIPCSAAESLDTLCLISQPFFNGLS